MAEVSDFTVAVLKFSFLTLLWLFVFSAVGVMRRDLFGQAEPTAATRAGSLRRQPAAATPTSTASGPPPSQIAIVQGLGSGQVMGLGYGPLTIGRGGSSHLVIADDYASTHHARLSARAGHWYLEDLNSTNGTFIGNRRVDSPVPVAAGTQIRIGNTVLELGK